MKVDRDRLKIFMTNIRIREAADQTKFTDKEIMDELASFLEKHPEVIDLNWQPKKPFTHGNKWDLD